MGLDEQLAQLYSFVPDSTYFQTLQDYERMLRDGLGLPGAREIEAAGNLKEWQAGLAFEEQYGQVETLGALLPDSKLETRNRFLKA